MIFLFQIGSTFMLLLLILNPDFLKSYVSQLISWDKFFVFFIKRTGFQNQDIINLSYIINFIRILKITSSLRLNGFKFYCLYFKLNLLRCELICLIYFSVVIILKDDDIDFIF